MAKGSSGVFRAGKVLSPDSKWTGDEPDWHGWEKWPIEKFMKERRRMFGFYGYYLAQADLKPAVLEYMKRTGYSKFEISLFRSANPNVFPATIGKLVRALDRGMPSLHPKAQEYFDSLPFHDPENPPIAKDEHDVIKKELHEVLAFLKSCTDEEDDETTEGAVKKAVVAKPNPHERLRAKVEKEVISKLEVMMDEWFANPYPTKVEPVSLVSYIRDGGIPGAGCKFISEWINKHLEELRGAFEKTDEQYVEGYSFLSKPALKNRITGLEGMLEEITKVTKTAKAARKPRVKKVKDASKQVSRLKYQANSAEFALDSINPSRVPSAQRLYVFNTKYKTISVYFANNAAGFEIKGTSIKNIAEDISFTAKVRKPKEVLDCITSSTMKQIDKALDALKCKKRKANGRINAQTVLVRVFENRG